MMPRQISWHHNEISFFHFPQNTLLLYGKHIILFFAHILDSYLLSGVNAGDGIDQHRVCVIDVAALGHTIAQIVIQHTAGNFVIVGVIRIVASDQLVVQVNVLPDGNRFRFLFL